MSTVALPADYVPLTESAEHDRAGKLLDGNRLLEIREQLKLLQFIRTKNLVLGARREFCFWFGRDRCTRRRGQPSDPLREYFVAY